MVGYADGRETRMALAEMTHNDDGGHDGDDGDGQHPVWPHQSMHSTSAIAVVGDYDARIMSGRHPMQLTDWIEASLAFVSFL